MTTEPVGKLNIDTRLVLSSISRGLNYLLTGIPGVAAIAGVEIATIAVAVLCIGALKVIIEELLGRQQSDAIAELNAMVSQLVASNAVLNKDATPTVKREAVAAAVAIKEPASTITAPVS